METIADKSLCDSALFWFRALVVVLVAGDGRLSMPANDFLLTRLLWEIRSCTSRAELRAMKQNLQNVRQNMSFFFLLEFI